MEGAINKEFLNRAFHDFAESSRRLERQYARLGRKLADLEREYSGKNRAAERMARLAAMGEMAAKIAHEIRNPLGSMLIFSTILCRELEGQPRRQKIAGHMVESVRNLDRILSDMLVFANRPDPVLRPVDMKEIIGKALEVCSSRKGASIEIRSDFSGDTALQADSRLLVQLFVNLFYNAFDAMGSGPGVLRVSVEPACEDTLEAVVQDTGCGMDEATQERIFDPFFTTRHSGTGLGLAICAAIAESHGGSIACRSAPGRGTAFTVRLPCRGVPGQSGGRA